MARLIDIAQWMLICILFYRLLLASYKMSYYEQTLKNHKEKFSPERWACIKKIINKKF